MTTIRWRQFGTALRPVPDPLPTSVVWMAAFSGALLLVAALGVVGGHRHPALVLAALCAFAALLGLSARFIAAPVIAAQCWLSYDTFVIAPQGELTWDGSTDAGRLGLLLASAVLATAIAQITDAAAAFRRMAPHATPPDTME